MKRYEYDLTDGIVFLLIIFCAFMAGRQSVDRTNPLKDTEFCYSMDGSMEKICHNVTLER